MQEQELDYVVVPLGLLVLGIYHVWLLYTIIRYPSCTVIGLNAHSRYQWVLSIMADPLKNGVLGVQTIHNNIMASTLATTAITLSSLIGIFDSNDSDTKLVYGNKTSLNSSIKRFSMSLCFLVAFVCNVQSIRYHAHAFYLSFPLVLWIYGPIPMFACCCLTSFILYFLDITTQITQDLHTKSFNHSIRGKLRTWEQHSSIILTVLQLA
ncbi:hypothetical protein AAZX31_05G227500 [Glycine max]|uniref:Uncharacterized protein n=1 Tax=Glycine max TaxID=3847 RepID=K7KRG3_SOYBN|nr:hypothetical protein GYH30_056969 [Glycine max]KRH60468.1 hypothetical protein GLYMA_05G242300v4 [Glycine max]